ncbi:MAG: glycosyl transferase family 1 [Pseudomonadota bacterium]
MADQGTVFRETAPAETGYAAFGAGAAPAGQIRVAYLGHDASDAAVQRRVRALIDDGLEVTGFMPQRRAPRDIFWSHVGLGETRDGAFAQRVGAIFSGADQTARHPDFTSADVIIARNLDMLALAFEAKRRARSAAPVIYECLDVHRLLTRSDVIGAAMRAVERALVRRCVRVWVSSPAFIEQHFNARQNLAVSADLMENRLPASGNHGPRPDVASPRQPGPLRLGWIGNLRCLRSFRLLLGLADRFGDRLEVHLHGVPARREIADFEPEIERRANVTFHGRYQAPKDLADIYRPLDAVWAGDFMEAGANSTWLLPNRVYEGGYFAVPALAPAGTQTAQWIEGRGSGLLIDEPLETALPSLVGALCHDLAPLQAARRRLAELPAETFVEPRGFVRSRVNAALAGGARA